MNIWKQLTRACAASTLLLLCGCIKDQDELTINADGSGTVKIRTECAIPTEQADQYSGQLQMFSGSFVPYPPLTGADARRYFPDKDFKVTLKQDKGSNDVTTTTIEAQFKSLDALLASPYGQAHQLTAKIANGVFVVKGVSGMEVLARAADGKDDRSAAMFAGVADWKKKKDEMSVEFRITLPNAVTKSNGTNAGKTAAWSFTRTGFKTGDDFARQLGTVSEAQCSASGLTFTVTPQIRLGLLPFAQLEEQSGLQAAGIDTNKILASAKFIPYGLTVKRSLDLAGEGSTPENSAVLVGAVVLPTENQPSRWDAPNLEEVTDAKGNDLKLPQNGENSFIRSQSFDGASAGGVEEDNSNAAPAHVVSLAFRPPDWKVKEIARVKGSIGMRFFGSTSVVKLTNAISPASIQKANSFSSASSSSEITSPALARSGLSLSFENAMQQEGTTMITLTSKGREAVIDELEVFDADGQPWPTFFRAQGSGDDGMYVTATVPGSPKGPLSLALKTKSGGTVVNVPILVEHVALTR